MDSTSFLSFRNSDEFCAELKNRTIKSIDTEAGHNHLEHRLLQSQIDSIVKFCVPVQKRQPDAREEIRRREDEISRILREQQKPVLQLTDLNSRVVVSGPAGTGKTLIAMEVARRAAEKGRRVALLCYNQLVGEWVRNHMASIQPEMPNLVVGRAIQVMAAMAGIDIPAPLRMNIGRQTCLRSLRNG